MEERKIVLFFRDALIIAFGVFIAAGVLGDSRIHYDNFLSLFWVAIVISLLNAFLRPLMITFALPILLTTFGIGAGMRTINLRSLAGTIFTFFVAAALALWFINACIFKLADVVAGNSFVVNGFGSAMLGSIFTSCATLFICIVFGIKRQNVIAQLFQGVVGNSMKAPPTSPENKTTSRKPREQDDDVIDI